MPPGREKDYHDRTTGLSWEESLYTGENGFLTVLVTLRWWWDEINELNDSKGYGEWMMALEDVYWVVGQVISTLR